MQEYFGTKPLSPLLELSIHNDRVGVFLLPSFSHQRHTVAFLPLSFGGHRVYSIPFWWVVRGQLQLGWWQACLSEKNNLSHRDLEHWGCDEAPTCHHTEARKKAMFLFLQSITGHSTETTPRTCWLWMVAVLVVVVTVAGLLNGLVMEYTSLHLF